MKSHIIFQNFTVTFFMAVVMSLAFLSFGLQAAHAEENTNGDNEVVETSVTSYKPESIDAEKRAAMAKQIESLRALIAERKSQMQTNQKELVAERKEMVAEKKAEFKIDREAFMADIEGLDEEGKRAAMIEFITKIKAVLEAKKAEHSTYKQEMKDGRTEIKAEKEMIRNNLHSNIDGTSKEAKIAAIMERVAALKQQIKDLKDSEEEEEDAG